MYVEFVDIELDVDIGKVRFISAGRPATLKACVALSELNGCILMWAPSVHTDFPPAANTGVRFLLSRRWISASCHLWSGEVCFI